MEVDEIQRQVTKFQRVCSNGSTTTTENINNNNNNSNPHKIATRIGNFEGDGVGSGADGGGGGMDVVVGGGGVARLCGWPASRIVRVSRASGGKDRHSKVLTSKGLRDRRVRLSVGTAIQFYDLQDRLGYDQPSKAVEWLLKAASSSIDELPSLDLPIVGSIPDHHHYHHHQMSSQKKLVLDESNNFEERNNCNNNATQITQATTQANNQVKSPVYSSTSETSKGSELSLSRAENRSKARERARELTSSKKEKEKEKETETNSSRVNVINHVNNISENSSFTDLLTGGINVNGVTTAVRSPMEYYFNRVQQTPPQLFQLPQFNMTTGDNSNSNSNNNFHQFSFFHQQQDNINNFSMTSPTPSSGGVAPGGYTRGTLQSNLQASILPHHHHLQRFQQSAIDGSAAANLPFLIVPNSGLDHFSGAGGYHFSYGSAGDHHKDKPKN